MSEVSRKAHRRLRYGLESQWAEAKLGSKGLPDFKTPSIRGKSLRMTATLIAMLHSPRSFRRAAKARRRGLWFLAEMAGLYKAARIARLPVLERRVFLRMEEPDW